MRDDFHDLTQQSIALGDSGRGREPARWTAVTLTPQVRWHNRPAISVDPHKPEKTMQAKLVKFRSEDCGRGDRIRLHFAAALSPIVAHQRRGRTPLQSVQWGIGLNLLTSTFSRFDPQATSGRS